MKKIIAFWALISLCAVMSAKQADPRNVILSVSHPDGLYAAGDTVKVKAESKADFPEGLIMEVWVNGELTSSQGETVSFSKGESKILFTECWNEPTAVKIFLKNENDKKTNLAQIGFIVDAGNLKPGFDNPDDFEKFWGGQLKDLRQCKAKPILTKYEFEEKNKRYEDKCDCWAFEINMPEGRPARGFIAIPKGAKDDSLPIVMHFHGAGYSISKADIALRYATDYNAIAIDMNAHGYEDVVEIAKELGRTELKDYRRRRVTDHKSFYYRLMYLRDIRALDYATTRPEWDGKRIMVCGASQGGGQSLAVAGIDHRVSAVCVEVPALTDMGGVLVKHSGGWPGYGASIKKGKNLKNEMAVLPYYDGATFARHIVAEKVWIEAGLSDTTCAAECVISAFNSLDKVPYKRLYTFPYRNHSTSAFDENERKEWKVTIDKPREAEIKSYLL